MILSLTDFISATAPAQPREAESQLPFRIVANKSVEIRVKTITSTLNLWKSVLKYHHQRA